VVYCVRVWRVVWYTDAWIITGGTQSGVMELVGQAVRDHMLQNGSYEQNLVVLGIAVLNVVAHCDALKKGATDAKVSVLCFTMQ
jgi:hypothetical protein